MGDGGQGPGDELLRDPKARDGWGAGDSSGSSRVLLPEEYKWGMSFTPDYDYVLFSLLFCLFM